MNNEKIMKIMKMNNEDEMKWRKIIIMKNDENNGVMKKMKKWCQKMKMK